MMKHRSFLKRRNTPKRAVNLAGKVARLSRAIGRPEVKHFQVGGTIAPTAAAGAIAYLSGIGQGSDDFNRIGSRINLKRLHQMVMMTTTSGVTAVLSYIIYIIKDLESSGVIPVVTGTAQAIFSNANPNQAFIQPAVKDRFKIVTQFEFAAVENLNGNRSPFRQKVLKRSDNMFYHDATGAQTGAGKNAFYIVALSNDAANTSVFTYESEFSYTDV